MFNLFDEPLDLQESQSAEQQPIQPTGMQSNIFVISIAGNMLFNSKPNASFIGKLSHSISMLQNEGYKFALVAGPGSIARDLASAARALGANNFQLDELGIKATELNAKLLVHGIANAFPEQLKDINKAREIIESNKIPVYARLMPGLSSDSIAALLSEQLSCNLIKLAETDGLYSNDPKLDEQAILFESISFKKLVQLIAKESIDLSKDISIPLDLVTALILYRSKIKTHIINANALDNFEALVRGQGFKGTTIQETD